MALRAHESPVRPPRITVAGAGNIGCYIGGCLALAHRHVTLLLRPGLAREIAGRGLRLSDVDGRERCLAASACRLTSDPVAALQRADIVLLTVKSGATAPMSRLIKQHAPAAAMVVSLQNGVGNIDLLRACLGLQRTIVAGMVPYNVVFLRGTDDTPRIHRATSGTTLIGDAPLSGLQAPGKVAGDIEGPAKGRHHEPAPGYSGGYSGGHSGPRVAMQASDLRDLLHVPGANCDVHPDMTGVLWGKLIINLNNALNALSGLPLVTQLADRRWRLLLAAHMQEALRVLKAACIRPAPIEGIPPRYMPLILRLPDPMFRLAARRMLRIDARARSSMWDDLQQRRPTEIAYLQGAIVALARKVGAPAPISEALMQRVQQAEAAGVGSPALQPDQCLTTTP